MMKKTLQILLGLLISGSALHAHSDAFTPQFVDSLVAPYLSIQEGLADDDNQAAQAGADAFLKAMKDAPEDSSAITQAAGLIEPAKIIAQGPDIKTNRTAFLDLSNQMTSFIQHVGVTSDTPLYTAYCSMAFGGKGGQWIQSDKP